MEPSPHTQGVFLARDIDPGCDDDAVVSHVDAGEQEHREVEVRERRGSPGVEWRLRLRHAPPTHRTLARAPRAHVRAQRLQAATILARRHAHEPLLDDAPVQRVVRGERPERGQRDLTGRMARPRGTPPRGAFLPPRVTGLYEP